MLISEEGDRRPCEKLERAVEPGPGSDECAKARSHCRSSSQRSRCCPSTDLVLLVILLGHFVADIGSSQDGKLSRI